MFGVAAAVSTVAASLALRSVAPRRIWATGQVVMAAGVVAPVVASNVGMLLFAAIAIGGTFMLITMAGMQEARRIAGNAAGRLIAAMTAAFALGQLLGAARRQRPVVAARCTAPVEPRRRGVVARQRGNSHHVTPSR